MAAATIATVAELAGVSPSTVSRVMTGHPAISEPVRQQVLRACREVHFVPRTRVPTIALIVAEPRQWREVDYVGILVSLLTRQLAARRYAMEVIESDHLDIATQVQMNAAIGIVFDDRIKQLAELPNLPILTINERHVDDGIHSVCTDHYMGGRRATEHLIEYGHRKIAFLEVQRRNWGSRERERGYREALQAANLPTDDDLVFHTSETPLFLILDRVRRAGCTALVNFSADVALEASHVLVNRMGLRIPRDISVVTVAADPATQYLTPPHTVIEEKYLELAALAVDHVIDLIEGRLPPEPPLDLMLDIDLVKRDSVAPPPC